MWGLLFFRYGKTNRSGDDFQWKDSLLYSDPKRLGMPGHGVSSGEAPVSQEVDGEGGNVGKRLYCGFHRKEWALQASEQA